MKSAIGVRAFTVGAGEAPMWLDVIFMIHDVVLVVNLPTICSIASSMLTRPATLPYSSTTTAR
ncbi:MAG: hypothetical protein U1F34_05745 [Gammaproteobacteria bacterium]